MIAETLAAARSAPCLARRRAIGRWAVRRSPPAPDAVEAGDVGDPGDSHPLEVRREAGQRFFRRDAAVRSLRHLALTGLRRCHCPGRAAMAASSRRWRRARAWPRAGRARRTLPQTRIDLRQQVARAVRLASGAATGARGSWPRAAQGRSIPGCGRGSAPRQSKPPPRRGAVPRAPTAPRRGAGAARAARSARRAPPLRRWPARSRPERPLAAGRDQHLGQEVGIDREIFGRPGRPLDCERFPIMAIPSLRSPAAATVQPRYSLPLAR